jgi:hypothetical protein
MTQDEIIEMADKADAEADNVLNMTGEYHPNWHQVRDEIFAKLVAEKAFEQGFYAGFKASGEGWNGECPFNDLGLDIQQNESVQHELKEAIRARGQA